ncbi:MAG: strawberry notch C-terminal domain-containing protein [Desulfovibrio sp.]|jgi:hypothetical protein|nr:strawberry notch C-terminal domain-containing protein [Desulfovibrio sp.]
MDAKTPGKTFGFVYKAYDRERFETPWGAVVTLGTNGRPAYDTGAAAWRDEGENGGRVIIHAHEGAVLATGQRDTKGGGSSNFWFVVKDSKAVQIERAAGMAVMRDAAEQAGKASETSAHPEPEIISKISEPADEISRSSDKIPRFTENGLVMRGLPLTEDVASEILAGLPREDIISIFPESGRTAALAFPKGYLGKLILARAFPHVEASPSEAQAEMIWSSLRHLRIGGIWYYADDNQSLRRVPAQRQITVEAQYQHLQWARVKERPVGQAELAQRVDELEEAYHAAEKLTADRDGFYIDGKRLTAEQAENALSVLDRERLLGLLPNDGERVEQADAPDAWLRLHLVASLYSAGEADNAARPLFLEAGLTEYNDMNSLPEAFRKFAGMDADAFPVFFRKFSENEGVLIRPFRSSSIYGWQVCDCRVNRGMLSPVWNFEKPENAANYAGVLEEGFSEKEGLTLKADGMPSEREAGQAILDIPEQPGSRKSVRDYGTPDNPDIMNLAEYYADIFETGIGGFRNIVEARKFAGDLLNTNVEKGTTLAKQVEEAIETGVVLCARRLVASGREKGADDVSIYNALVNLYNRMPTLGTRTSTSVANQAYSTPVPIAFLASRLAGINENDTVYEPAAGNGALLIEANVAKAIVNELDPLRAENLREQGFGNVTVDDATQISWSSGREPKVDKVIANPPFGHVTDPRLGNTTWDTGQYRTPEIDHAIFFKSLEAMKDDGRAVILIAGKKGTEEMRSKDYRALNQRQFYQQLFDNYIVEDHFCIDGSLYSRQGAGWPIDVLVIGGRGKTENRIFPGANPPRVYKTFDELASVFTRRDNPVKGDISNQKGEHDEKMVDAPERVVSHDAGSAGGLERRNREREQSAVADRDESGESAAGEPGSGESGRGVGHAGGPGEARRNVRPELSSGQGERNGHSDGTQGASDQPLPGRGGDAPRLSPESEPDGGSGDRGSDVRRVGGHDSGGELTPAGAPWPRETVFQVPYQKASQAYSMGTLVPKNMASAVHNALARLQNKRGDIDGFVAGELGCRKEDLPDYFAGEQIDAIALAIDNLRDGAGFIIGDQTGIGKGRVNAAIIRWAKRQGKIPVFVTMTPELYASMVEDLSDIGMPGFTPLATNNKLSGKDVIALHDGRVISTKSDHSKELEAEMRNGVANYDGVFTTYKQLAAHGDKPTPRREFLSAIARDAVFILDESHNAGGEVSKPGARQNIAAFIRSLLQESPNGAFYSSATYAKRPDNMPLYFKTDMSIAVQNMDRLAEAVGRGGIPMQQAVAAMLAKSGQYIRRERSLDGAEVNTKIIPIDTGNAECSASIMRAIMAFDEMKGQGVRAINETAARTGGVVTQNKSTGKAGADSCNFTSTMHNFISQSLLTQKAASVVDEAEAMVRRGEKVVIALSNTMGSMIDSYAKENNLRPGDRIDLSFKDLFLRYLEKSRTINIKDAKGDIVESRLMTDEEIGPVAVTAYENALSLIEESDFSALPASPIDYLMNELRGRGIGSDEITGRTARIDYSGDFPTYAVRKTSSAVKQSARERFNSGEVDVLVINQAGSTGINLHASEKFGDQRRRNMIIAQPELDINVFMQTLGRVFRTGQVCPPAYHLLFSNLPAEKRVAAVLSKKMGSLNANTTAGKDSDASFKNIPDFLNTYGDQVAASIVRDDPVLNRMLGYPVNEDASADDSDAMRKVTGRIPVLPIAEQESLYDLLESEYIALVAQKEAMGGSGLEAKALPLDARPLSSFELTPSVCVGKETPFAEASNIGMYDVKKLGKPYSSAKVKELAEAGKASAIGVPEFKEMVKKWDTDRRKAMRGDEKNLGQAAYETFSEKTKNAMAAIACTLGQFEPGVAVDISADSISLKGIVTKVTYNQRIGNPTALGAWKIDVAVADAVKSVSLSFSQIVKGADRGGVNVEPGGYEFNGLERRYALFDAAQSQSRERVCIATGNILSAYDKLSKGRIVTFSDSEGNVIPGIILPQGETPEKALANADVSLNAEQAMGFLKEMNSRAKPVQVKTDDKIMRIMMYIGGTYNIYVPAAKAAGGQYFLNKAVIEAAGQDFIKNGNEMSLKGLDEARAGAVLKALAAQGCGFVADSFRDEAREYVNLTTPRSVSMHSKLQSAADIQAIGAEEEDETIGPRP